MHGEAMRRLLIHAILTTLLVSPSMAQSESGVDALLEAAASGQSLEFARAVESMGDAQVVEFLGAGHPVGVRLAAAYASVWVEEPTLVIVALAELAAGRDPDLAPAAAI